ncbi:MAG: hypothetical protein HeimAB125_15350 [Candidatus Heimdallarchaeota archaeon AB_125]|nr:MAG: hypothetical protein HeimAB125_15350 [Candidatus Heimdallarchaeota archaeon AB_125]
MPLQEDGFSCVPRCVKMIFMFVQSTYQNCVVPDFDIEDSPYALKYGTKPEGKVPLKEMKKEFDRITSGLKKEIEKLTPEQEDEVIDTGYGINTRAELIAGMLLHDHSHFGQIVSTIKRIGDYSDQDLREKLIAAMKKQKETEEK